jgi:RNA polymerase sigma-70 factor (ECF subfamily)
MVEKTEASEPEIAMTREHEAALVAQAKQDRLAFGRLYELHVHRMYNYIYYRTGNHHDAEDLTARVFFKALEHIGRYQDRGAPFSAWLYRIAHNMVANWHRDNRWSDTLELDEAITHAVPGDDPHQLTERTEAQERLLQMIQKLPVDRQQLLILKFVTRCSNVEIGEIMGRSEGAIKSLYHRTLLALRRESAGDGGGG